MKDYNKIKIIISDIDGVWTDGSVYKGTDNMEFKKFSVFDGVGVAYARAADLKIAIIIISIITSILCQLGDLFFSYLKRKAKLKDTGKFLPGHGGILDRLDGIFFGIPFGLISLILLF